MSEHVQEQEPGLEQEQQPTIWEAGRHPVNIGQLVMGLAFLGLVAVWALFTSVHFVQPGERATVTRFGGKYVDTFGAGTNWSMPWPTACDRWPGSRTPPW